jgi:hypothetical protein
MTTDPTDPDRVILTGENSFIRLQLEAGGPQTTRISHWRVLHSPAGPGHALFLKSDVVDDRVCVYSDNIALARWLQEEIESVLFPAFSDQALPVTSAEFTKSGDSRSCWTETVESDKDTFRLTWYDFIEPFMLRVAAGSVPGRPHGVYSCFIPARKAQVTVNNLVAQGRPFPEMRGARPSSTSCLAWSETWVKP